MARKVKDGWHSVYGMTVLVEDGRIRYGVGGTGLKYHTTHPYQSNGHTGWYNITGVTLEAFRSGVRRGTMDMK